MRHLRMIISGPSMDTPALVIESDHLDNTPPPPPPSPPSPSIDQMILKRPHMITKMPKMIDQVISK